MSTASRRLRVIDRKTNVLAAAVLVALAGLPAAALAAPAAGTTTTVAASAEPAPADADASSQAADAQGDGAAAGDAEAGSSAPATTLNAVMVSAQKREQAAIDVPASVTALEASRLSRSGATQLEDYSAQVPGMSVTSNGGSMQVTLRGISTGLSQAAPTTAVYVDEAPVGSTNNYAAGSGLVPDIDPSELRQIEVSKGPQGTLYGGGAMGGVLRYVTRAPSFDKFSGSATLGVSDVAHGDTGPVARVALNMPASDNLAFRASAFRRVDGGYIDNPLGGPLYGLPTDDTNEVTTTGGRLALAWRLGDAWRLDASWYSQKRDADGGTWVDVDRHTLEPTTGEYEHSYVVPETNTTTLDVGNVTLRGPIGGVEFISSTTWQNNDADARNDATQSFGLLVGLLTGDFTWGLQSHQVIDTRRFSQEFRIEDTAFADKLYWSMGLYYTNEDSRNRIPSFPTISLLTGDPKVVYIPGTAIPFPDQVVKARIDSTYRELSYFANATFTFNDKFDLQGGVRFGHDEQHYDQYYHGLLFPAGVGLVQDSENDKFTWLLTGRFHPTDTNSFYARIATGYRPGGPSAATPLIPFPAVVGPDSLISYEAGWKTVAFDDKLSFEFAAYRTDWKDIIIQTSLAGTQFFVNGGTAKSQGWEATLGLFPVQGLNLRGTLSYTDARLTEDTPGIFVAPGVPLGKDGDRLPFVPEWTGSLLGDYTWSVGGNWTATLGASVNYVGERKSDYSGRGVLEVPSYTTVNASASVQNANWQFTLYGKNLNDSDGIIYLIDRGLQPFAPTAALDAGMIRPRTIGLDVTYRF